MSLEVEGHKDNLVVTVPPTRHDIIHPCDIYEDLAIAHGYNNIEKTFPKVSTVGKEVTSKDFILPMSKPFNVCLFLKLRILVFKVPLNKLTDLLRESVANVGFTEALTFALVSQRNVSFDVSHL